MATVHRKLQLPLADRRHLSHRYGRQSSFLRPTLTLALIAAALWLSYVVIGFSSNVVQIKLNDIKYGYPRTFQTDGYIGYRESSGLPTHFTVINAHRQVLIMILPGTDPGHVTVIKGPYLLGSDQDFDPATLELKDLNHDGFADLVLRVAGQTITYLNNPHKQTFVMPHVIGGGVQMKGLTVPMIAATALLIGGIGLATIRPSSGNAGAYDFGASAVYSAQVLSSASTTSHNALPFNPQAATPALPSAHTSAIVKLANHAGIVVAPANSDDVQSKPTISPALIDSVLASYGSPMAGDGQQIYDLGVKYGIDPAFCLAFFVHESAAGTRGEAVLTHNLGNIRSIAGAASLDGYRYYDTWLEGTEAWYQLISSLYVQGWGLTTVSKIIPVYAPSADSNDPTAYINDVQQLVATWRAQE